MNILNSLTVGVLMCFCLSGVYAQNDEQSRLKQRTPHNKNQFENMTYDEDSVRIVFKLHDGSGVRSRNGLLYIDQSAQDEQKLKKRGVQPMKVAEQVSTLNQLIRSSELESFLLFDGRERELSDWSAQAERYWGEELAELSTYQQLVLHDGGRSPRLPELIREIRTFNLVETVYMEPIALPHLDYLQGEETPPDPHVCKTAPLDEEAGDLTSYQGYRGPGPVGLGVDAIAALPGGQGAGIRIIDIEGGYDDHSDRKQAQYTVGNINQYYESHGSAVLGVIGMKDNGIGLTGLAPEAWLGFRAIYNANLFDDWIEANSSSANVASNIYWAAQHSLNGVVLIELQRPGPIDPNCHCGNTCAAIAVEFWPAEFDVIKAAVGNGVSVVQAAGNGGRNLDSGVLGVCNGGCFDRDNRDSGSVLVSGSLSDGVTPVCEIYGSPNYGTRIDVHSWSENIATAGYKDLYDSDMMCNDYQAKFGGTSGASALIAGVVTALQGIHLAYSGEKMDALALRDLLRDTGYPQVELKEPIEGGQNILIGPHPNLELAADIILGN